MIITDYALLAIQLKKANWICHILSRNCFTKHVIIGKIEWKRRRRGRRRQILYIFKGKKY
jgi:hypothetical protein